MTNFADLIDKYQDINQSSEAAKLRPNIGVRGALLRFPLEKEDDYGGTVTFRARQVESVELTKKSASFLKDFVDDVKGAGQSVFGNNSEKEREQAAQDGSAVQDAVDQMKNGAFDLKNKKGTAAGNGRSDIGGYSKEGKKCTMYLPPAIQVQDRVSYSNTDLGPLGAAARAGLMSGQTFSEMAVAGVSGIATDVFEFAKLLFGYDGNVANEETATIAAMKLTPGVVSGAVSSATGVAINPNKRALLSGPELRTFSFSFRMIPTSAAEANAIEQIIQFFREEMYPDAPQQIGSVAAGLRYPSIFDIIMRYRSSDGRYHKVATGILPCFLNSLDTNYNQTAMSFHRDGKPQEVTLTLVFTEERALNRYDVAVRGY